MKKRIISCLLILALLLPTVAAFAATMEDIAVDAVKGQAVTLQESDFIRAFDNEGDASAELEGIIFTAIPVDVTITLGEDSDIQGEIVELGDITVEGLTLVVDADTDETEITVPVSGLTDLEDTDSAIPFDLVIRVTDADEITAKSPTYTVVPGETVQVILGVEDEDDELTYVYTIDPDAEFNHGTLEKDEEAEDDYTWLYTATSVGTDSFTYTVTAGTLSAEGTVTIKVEKKPLAYRDIVMENHWATTSPGMLAELGLVVGEEARGHFFFYPEETMTRGEFVIWACAVFGFEPDEPVKTEFSDPDIPAWMAGYLSVAAQKNLIDGIPVDDNNTPNVFKPYDQITKVEAIKIICQGLKLTTIAGDLEDTGFTDYRDIPDWAKNYVLTLADHKIITGNSDGTLAPNKVMTRAESAELLYKAYTQIEHDGIDVG